jgi:predicted porin
VNNSLLQAVTSVNSANALFDRQAFVGMVTPVGALLAGRMYTPGYEIENRFTSFADQTAGQIGQGYSALAIRANNALQYRAEAGGFGASVMYGFGGTEVNRNERVSVRNGDDFLGINLMYNAPDFGAGIGFNRNNTVTFDEPNTKKTGLKTLNVGGRYTIGPVRLFVHYMTRKNDNPVLTPADLQNIVVASGGNLATITSTLGALYLNAFDVDLMRGVPGKVDTKIYHLGAVWTVGPGDLYFAFNRAKDKANDDWDVEDAKVNHFGLSYFYNLSKRTQLVGTYATARNKGASRMGLGAAGYSGGFTTVPGQSSTVVQAGMRHAF